MFFWYGLLLIYSFQAIIFIAACGNAFFCIIDFFLPFLNFKLLSVKIIEIKEFKNKNCLFFIYWNFVQKTRKKDFFFKCDFQIRFYYFYLFSIWIFIIYFLINIRNIYIESDFKHTCFCLFKIKHTQVFLLYTNYDLWALWKGVK